MFPLKLGILDGKSCNIYWIYVVVHDETPHNKNMSIHIKVGLSPSKKIYVIYFNGKPFKNDEKCFLFHRKSSFCSQDI